MIAFEVDQVHANQAFPNAERHMGYEWDTKDSKKVDISEVEADPSGEGVVGYARVTDMITEETLEASVRLPERIVAGQNVNLEVIEQKKGNPLKLGALVLGITAGGLIIHRLKRI